MKPRFEGVLGGFDKVSVPKWQIIVKGDVAIIWLYDADDAEVKVLAPGIVQIEEFSQAGPVKQPGGIVRQSANNNRGFRIFRLKGLMTGKTFVEARRKGRLLERLEVLVVDLIEFAVTFNYVSDNAGHRTQRNSADLDDLLLVSNLRLQTDAGLKIVKKDARPLAFDRNLGRIVRAENVWDIIAGRRDKSAVFNVFFVWEYEQDDTPNVDNAEAAALNRVCLYEDSVAYEHQTLIHELSHLMTLPHYSVDGYFMNDWANESAEGFRRNEVLAMRRGLKHIMKLTGL